MKLFYYLIIFISIVIGNKYFLAFKNIKSSRFEINQPCELTGAHVFNLTGVNVNQDNFPDTIEVTEAYCFEWLSKQNSAQLLKVSSSMKVGITSPSNKDKSCIKSVTIHKSDKLLLMLIIEQNGNNYQHVQGWKVVGFKNGIFCQRTPTIIEYISYLVKNDFPAASVGAGG